MTARPVVWVSTSTRTRGGVATYVRTMQQTPLWDRWRIRHVVTHRNGSIPSRIAAFAGGAVRFTGQLLRRPAVVHLHSASYGSFARKSVLARLARLARVPVVFHVHGAAFREFYAASPAPLRRYIRSTLERADAVIALGARWSEVLAGIAPAARILVVPNAVHPADPVRQPAAGEPVQVLFLGEVEDRKGVFLLLRAWRDVRASAPDREARLVLAGAGELARARALVAELGIGDQVEVRGWVAPPEVEGLLRASHVLVLPSTVEGQPMAVLEAMAHGLCVVASSVGGVPDLVEESGVLVPSGDRAALADALERVLGDPDLRRDLGARALERVREHLDVDRTWRALDALYRELSP